MASRKIFKYLAILLGIITLLFTYIHKEFPIEIKDRGFIEKEKVAEEIEGRYALERSLFNSENEDITSKFLSKYSNHSPVQLFQK